MATILLDGPGFTLEDLSVGGLGQVLVERVAGVDLDFPGDLLVGRNGDLVLTHGIEGLKQSIARSLVTSPGEFPGEPTYGIGADDFLGLPASAANVATLKSRVRQSILSHPLVEAIEQLEVSQDADGLILVETTIRTGGQREEFSIGVRRS